MTLILYERLCTGNRRPSPYCWRARLALAHKGLAPEVRAIKFTEADQVAFSGQGKVPVLIDGGAVVFDSWAIACHLEARHPEAPALFGGPGGREATRLLNHWVDQGLQRAFAPILAPSLHALAHPDDQAYYRDTREARWGMTLEELRAGRPAYREALNRALEPLRARLVEAPFLCGAAPAYGDYLVFAEFQWARCVDPEDLLAPDDRDLRTWRGRMLDLFDGLARSVPAFATAA